MCSPPNIFGSVITIMNRNSSDKDQTHWWGQLFRMSRMNVLPRLLAAGSSPVIFMLLFSWLGPPFIKLEREQADREMGLLPGIIHSADVLK